MRSFGAAVSTRLSLTEPSIAERTSSFRLQKDAIGAWCADQVVAGETVLLDAGTTTARIAAHLRDRREITVVTTGLSVLSELAHADAIEVLVLGGRLRKLSQGLVGPLADASLGSLTFDRAFLGADGLRADLGICEAEIEQTRTKELIASRADRVYVAADSSKLGAAPFNAWARVDEYTLVTDDGASDESLDPFRHRAGTDIVLASPDHFEVPAAGR
jgi:DeoR/GlpR family transcriptional regulator of sugar metabolism